MVYAIIPKVPTMLEKRRISHGYQE